MMNAKWITPADCPAEGTAAFWVKRDFEVGSVPQSSVLQITADSFYRKNCGKVPTRTDRFGKNKGVIYSKGYQDWQDDSDKYDVR